MCLSRIFILLLAFMAGSASVIFQDCGSAYDLKTVNIEGCGWMLPCYITLGEDVKVSLEFHAGFMSRNLDQDVVIHINHLNLRTPVNPEHCEMERCPVQVGAVANFTSVMSIPTSVALDQRGYLRWRVDNESGRQVLCYSVLVQTQSPLQKLLRRFAGVTPTTK